MGHPGVPLCHGRGDANGWMHVVGLSWEPSGILLGLGGWDGGPSQGLCPSCGGPGEPADPLLISGADHLHNPTESLPLAMAKEAKVSELEDDQLAEEDLPVLDNQ